MKYSKIAAVVRWSGGTSVLERGMSAADDHPLVVERPDLFTDQPPGAQLVDPDAVRGSQGPPAVEAATRAPGETRQVARPPAKPKKDSKGQAVEGQADEGQGGAGE